MKKSMLIVAASALLGSFAADRVSAQVKDTVKKITKVTTTPVPTQDVITVLADDADYSTASAAIKTAGLEETLKSGGPYTIFAPNNSAFNKLPPGKLDSLTKDRKQLTAFLSGMVVKGKYTKADIIKALTDGKGKATLTTLDGQTLALSVSPAKTLQLTNAAGSSAEVTLYDLVGTDGVANGINGVLLPAR